MADGRPGYRLRGHLPSAICYRPFAIGHRLSAIRPRRCAELSMNRDSTKGKAVRGAFGVRPACRRFGTCGKAGASAPHSKRCRELVIPLGFMAPTHVQILEVFPLHEPRSATVPAASCGGVPPPARTPGGTPGELAGEDACATFAGGSWSQCAILNIVRNFPFEQLVAPICY
jgi:hypothetical protein